MQTDLFEIEDGSWEQYLATDDGREKIAQNFRIPFNALQHKSHAPKLLPGGLKPVEEFCDDIRNDLVAWSFDKDSIFYRTSSWIYRFKKEDGVVEMMRVDPFNFFALEDWANEHSVAPIVGKEWLSTQKDKLIRR